MKNLQTFTYELKVKGHDPFIQRRDRRGYVQDEKPYLQPRRIIF